jgi:hypothetical protein
MTGALAFGGVTEQKLQANGRMKLSNGMTSLATWIHYKKETSVVIRILVVSIAIFVSLS